MRALTAALAHSMNSSGETTDTPIALSSAALLRLTGKRLPESGTIGGGAIN